MEKFIDDLERLLKLRKAADAETKPLIDRAIEALIAEHTPPRSITIERVSPEPGLPDPWKPHYISPVITCCCGRV